MYGGPKMHFKTEKLFSSIGNALRCHCHCHWCCSKSKDRYKTVKHYITKQNGIFMGHTVTGTDGSYSDDDPGRNKKASIFETIQFLYLRQADNQLHLIKWLRPGIKQTCWY